MIHHWLKKPQVLIFGPLALLLVLAVACGSAAEPPAAEPPAAPAVQPTAVPQAAAPPAEEMMAKGKQAPKFADYWNPPTEVYGEPVYGGTLRINYEDPLEHANSWGASTGAAHRIRSATMSNIVSEDPYDNNKIIPDLAEAWTQEDDASGITFNFHEGVKWHNGADFTCEDARFSLQTFLTGEGITASSNKSVFNFVDPNNYECTDDLTLRVGFKGPSAIGLPSFTFYRSFIFNKAWFQEGGEDAMFSDASVGTGAFTWDEGQTIGFDEQHFTKNPNYFKGNGALPYVDNLTIFGILDESTQQAQMLAHQTDWHWVRNFGQYNAYVAHDQIRTVIRATRGHHHLWFNRRLEPFDNVRVRQAIVMGMDRRAAIAVLQEGFGSEGFTMVPGSAWELSREKGCAVPGWCSVDDHEAKRAEAIQILKEEGFDFDKVYRMTVESDAQVGARSVFVQEQLRLLGIKTDFDQIETVAYRQVTTSGQWGHLMGRNATMQFDDPAAGMGAYHHSDSITGNYWMPVEGPLDDVQKQMDALLDEAAITVDPAKRRELSDQIQLLAMNQYWRFPLYWEQEAVSFWPEVRGYSHFPTPNGAFLDWAHLWIDPAHANDGGYSGQTSGIPGGI
ncbi:MAG: ABC transporter substrate-binding protein [Dehalococcoidia bacterium]